MLGPSLCMRKKLEYPPPPRGDRPLPECIDNNVVNSIIKLSSGPSP